MRFGFVGFILLAVVGFASWANAADELQAPSQVDPTVAAVAKQWDLLNTQMNNFLTAIGTVESNLVATQTVVAKQEAEKATLIEWLKAAQDKTKPQVTPKSVSK